MTPDFWNQRYAEPGFAYGTEPNAFLASQHGRLRPGMMALAVADGEGRNGVWLACQGLDVLSVDASEVGQRKTREFAAQRGVRVRTEQADLAHWQWPVARFDLVAAIYAHFPPDIRPAMHRAMYEALAPGGILVLEAFGPQQLNFQSGGPRTPEMLYTVALLRADLANVAPTPAYLHLEETLTELDEGRYHRGRAAVLRALVQRPA